MMLSKKEKVKKFSKVFLRFILFFAGWVICIFMIPMPENENPAVYRLWAELIPLVSIVIMTFVFGFIDKKNISLYLVKRPLFSICFGIAAALIWLGITVALLMGAGVLKFDGTNTVSFLWLWIISALLNTIMQELLVRGYLYQLIKVNYNRGWATVITTALFTLMHVSAFETGIFPVLNILSISLIITGMLEYTGSLLAPIVFHFIWNTIGGIILNCLSLADDYPHLLNAVFTGNSILTGGIYKIEGSAVLFIINIILIILAFVLKKTGVFSSLPNRS